MQSLVYLNSVRSDFRASVQSTRTFTQPGRQFVILSLCGMCTVAQKCDGA